MIRNKHCYPKQTETWIDSCGNILKTKQDITDHCHCTMQELCVALLDMASNDKERMLKFIHKATNDQKDLSF